MEEKKFRTSAKCMGCVNAIGAELDKMMPHDDWSIDLQSPDKVLTVRSAVADDKIIAAVSGLGFKIEKL
ncbi:MAG: heavy metal transport/detoxification protein [Bacteroidetes bacterium]|uniref:Heavy metal transport/detoxification protein n=1 Tax=Candidatus Limisoma faecipullorum TaxID=2840854 RepID=A0A9D9IMY9_9BACT|nr:heavy metal transport/detoxification protein [Candidatus Limisoma faecipullorum]